MEFEWHEDIYVMTFLPTGKKYVGKTTYQLKYRLAYHLSKLKRGVHSSKELQRDFDAYKGTKDDFSMKLVGRQKASRGNHMDTEREWMIKLKTYDTRYGYNSQDLSMQRLKRLGTYPEVEKEEK